MLNESDQLTYYIGIQKAVSYTHLDVYKRQGLTPIALGEADPTRMGAELADWGSYYDSRPLVMAGDIHGGHQRLLQLGAYPRLGHQPLYALEDMPDVVCS